MKNTTTLSRDEREHKARYESDACRGDVQCTYRYPHGDDGYLCCSLRLGHPGMHCHVYDIPSPTEGWFDAGPRSEDEEEDEMDRCRCGSLDVSVAKVEQPFDMLDVTLGKTVSVPCSQTVHTCGVCGFEWTDVIGEYERTEASLQYWMRRAKELYDKHESAAAEGRRWAHDGNLVKQIAFVSQEPKQTGRGDPTCYGCDKVWRHHNRGEVGTVCGIGEDDGVHPYGPACHVHLTAPGSTG